MAIFLIVARCLLWLPKTLVETFFRGCMLVAEVISQTLRGVKEFGSEDCILRVGMGHASVGQVLSDGTAIERGERVGEFHLSNERMPTIGHKGRTLAWGLLSYSKFRHSMHILSQYADGNPRYKTVRSFRGETAFTFDEGELQRVSRALGFDCIRVRYRDDWWGCFAEFWENFYTWMLVWTYNPASLQGKGLLRLKRYQLWMSRETLYAKYGQAPRRRATASLAKMRSNGKQEGHLEKLPEALGLTRSAQGQRSK